MQNKLLGNRPSIISLLDDQIDKEIDIEEEATKTITSILENANDVCLLLDRMQKTRSTRDEQLLQISRVLRKDLFEILEQFPRILENSGCFMNSEECEKVEEFRLTGSKLAHRTSVFLMSLETICSRFKACQEETIGRKRMRSWGDSSE